MLYPTAGSRLYIADSPVDTGGVMPTAGWVEITSVEALGMLGIEWEMDSAVYLARDGEIPEENVTKGARMRSEMPIVMGNDPSDAGQLLVWKAANSAQSFPFKLIFPDGVQTRTWFALVFRIAEVFDTANTLMKLQADLKPTSAVQRTP